jgi:hypothetical protein
MCRMTFPIVNEIPPKLEPSTGDTFGGATAGALAVAPSRRRIVD